MSDQRGNDRKNDGWTFGGALSTLSTVATVGYLAYQAGKWLSESAKKEENEKFAECTKHLDERLQDDCGICRTRLLNKQSVVTFNCGHSVHSSCFDQMRQYNTKQCPYCRTRITKTYNVTLMKL